VEPAQTDGSPAGRCHVFRVRSRWSCTRVVGRTVDGAPRCQEANDQHRDDGADREGHHHRDQQQAVLEEQIDQHHAPGL
jgi:hypothetical protein